MTTTNTIGNLGEVALIKALTQIGWTVSLPITHNVAYDMIADDGKTRNRIQVKTTTSTEDRLYVKVQRTHQTGGKIVCKNYSADDFEYLGVYDIRTDTCYLVPIEHVVSKSCLTLRLQTARNNQVKGIFMAGDFLITNYK